MAELEVPGEKVTLADAAAVAREASSRIASALKGATGAGGGATLALSGGNTPRDAYARLAHEPGVDWGRVHVFWVDERAVPPTDDRSNYRWAKATLLDAAGIPAAQVHRMAAERTDGAVATRDYEAELRQAAAATNAGFPVIDVVVLGIGDDGHTASLFPGDPTVDVRDRCVAAVAAAASREARMTLTAPALEQATQVFVLAVGSGKREALRRAWSVEGDVHVTPARVLRRCRGRLTWIVDAAADATGG
jgi:6-phosphogluconolactonase